MRFATIAPVTSATPARRPGGRSERVRTAVYAAVGELVGEGHREAMTIPQIAERADVNPTSVYRRWGTVDALLEQVAVAALTNDEPLPDTGSLVGDLEAWAEIIADDITRPERVTYLRAMVAARKGMPDACPCWDTRTVQVRRLVGGARGRGEPAPEPEQVLNHVVAPLYHHVVFGLRADRAYARSLVSDVMAMAGSRRSSADPATR